MKHLIGYFLIIVVLLVVSLGAAYPPGEVPIVLQSGAKDQQASLFVSDTGPWDEVTVRVSGTRCEEVSVHRLDEGEVPIMTTVLIDNTGSMPTALRPLVKTFLSAFIAQRQDNEQIELLLLGAELNTIHAFGSDNDSLTAALDKITFQDQTTNIYESIQQKASELRQNTSEELAFHQIVIITDGMEDYDAGIIKQELYLYISNNKYPIHTIGLPIAQRNENDLKELFAISRISDGRSFSLASDADTESMATDLHTFSMSSARVNFTVPASLLDGAVRQVSVTFEKDGAATVLEYDMKMPVVEVVPTIAPSPTPAASATPAPTPEPTFAPTPEPEPEAPVEKRAMWWIIPVVLVIAGGIALIVLLSIKKAAKKNEQLFRFDTHEHR